MGWCSAAQHLHGIVLEPLIVAISHLSSSTGSDCLEMCVRHSLLTNLLYPLALKLMASCSEFGVQPSFFSSVSLSMTLGEYSVLSIYLSFPEVPSLLSAREVKNNVL